MNRTLDESDDDSDTGADGAPLPGSFAAPTFTQQYDPETKVRTRVRSPSSSRRGLAGRECPDHHLLVAGKPCKPTKGFRQWGMGHTMQLGMGSCDFRQAPARVRPRGYAHTPSCQSSAAPAAVRAQAVSRQFPHTFWAASSALDREGLRSLHRNTAIVVHKCVIRTLCNSTYMRRI